LRRSREFRAAVEELGREHGRYPERLGELSLPREQTRLPCGTAWTYSPPRAGESEYRLSLGDSSVNHFMLYWDAETRSCVTDP